MLSGQETTAQGGHQEQAAGLRFIPAPALTPTLVSDPDRASLGPDPAPRPHAKRPSSDGLAALRAQIGAIEQPHSLDDGEGAGPLSFGAAAVDSALPWGGLPRGCLHEIVGGEAAAGFAAGLAARLAGGAHLAA